MLVGLVVGIASTGYFIPMSDVIEIDPRTVRLRSRQSRSAPFRQRDGELLLKENMLGHRLIDVARSALVKAYDVRLAVTEAGWCHRARRP